jgi:hypothetical protein
MIYVTPFNYATGRCTGPSVDSGFVTQEQVVELLGPPKVKTGNGLIYGDADDRVFYSERCWSFPCDWEKADGIM